MIDRETETAVVIRGVTETVTVAKSEIRERQKTTQSLMPAGLLEALQRALALFADPARYGAVQQRGMARDFSWKSAAGAYDRLYQDSL